MSDDRPAIGDAGSDADEDFAAGVDQMGQCGGHIIDVEQRARRYRSRNGRAQVR